MLPRTKAVIAALKLADASPIVASDFSPALGPQLRPGVVFECVGVPGVIANIFEKAMRKTRIGFDGVAAAFEELKSPVLHAKVVVEP